MPLLDLNWLVSTNRRPRSPSIAANVATNEEYVTTSPTGAKSRTLISPPTPTTTTTVTTVKANTNGTAVANTSATVSAQTILSRSASTDSLKKRKNTFVLHFGSLRFGKNVFTSEPEEQERDPGDAAHQRHDSKFADDKSTHSADSTVQLQSVGDEEQDNEVDERDETEKDNEAEQDNEAERVSEDSEAVPDNEVEQINEAERIYEDNEAERINEDNEAEQDNEVEQNNEAERIYEDSEAERINEENEAEQDNEIEQNNEAERINEEQDDETEQDNEAELRSEVEQDKAEDNVLAQAIRAGQPDCELDDKATQIAHPDYELAHPGYELAQPRYELTQPGYELAQPRYELAQPGYELAQPGYELAQPGDELTLPSQQEGELTQQEGELTQQPQPDCELAQPDGDIEPAKPTELTPPCNEPAQSNQSQSNDLPHDVASQTDSELNKVPLSQPNGEPTHPAQPDITSHSERKQIHSEFEQLYRRITSQLDSQAMFQINHHQQQRMPRVKVQWQDTRLVIPVPVQKGSKQPVTVARLLKEIDARFRKHAKGLDDDNYFVELRTIDGFVLDKSDRAADVIGDGDVLCAIDYSNWFKNFKAENSLTEWLSVRRIDYVDNNHKWVRVGQTTRANQIYFDFGTGVYGAEESKRFRVIDEEEIESLPKPSRKFIEGVKGGQDPDRWFADAYIVTDETGTRHVEITVKSMSDHRPQIETLCFARNVDGKYQMKSKKVIQAVFVPSVPKAYTVSTIMTEGPTLKEDDYPTPLDPSKVVVQSTGESPFMLQQTGYPLAEQHWDYSGAWQLVTCAFRITNTASKTLSVIGISAEVQDKKGEWRSALAYSGGKESAIYYNIRNEHDAILRYDAHSVNKLSLRVKYGLDYTNYKSYSGRARRLHPSLPNPCNIRFTLRDQNDTRTSIVLQAFGTGGFMTRRAYEERLHMKLYHWVQCDDTNSEERMYVPIEYKQGWASHSVLEINLLVASRKHQIEAEVLRRWTWLANREGVSELEIKDWNWEGSDGAFGIKFHALFDCDEKQVYGMKITLHTTTSKVVDSFLFPKDLIMQ